jgi:hypothetical protein
MKALRKRVLLKSPVREFRTPGSERGLPGNRQFYRDNIKTGTKTHLFRNEGEKLISFVVSPDHRLLAYFAEHGTSRTIIAKADGQLLRIITGKRWFSNYGWSEDNRLLVNYLSPVSQPEFYILAFNPITSETETFIPDFPDMAIWGPAGWNETESSYDPSLTLVVYAVGANLGNWVDIVLWDIYAQREIIRLENPSGGSSTLVWSPDGKQFVVDVSPDQTREYDYDDLFSVSREGVIRRLTFLTDYYEKVEIRDYSWSPDSRLLALWYSFEDGTFKIGWDYYLAVYDTSEQKSTSYCIRRGENSLFSLPIWSPESNMLLVDGFVGSTEIAVDDQTLLLDVLNNQAFVVASDMIPAGWLVSEP